MMVVKFDANLRIGAPHDVASPKRTARRQRNRKVLRQSLGIVDAKLGASVGNIEHDAIAQQGTAVGNHFRRELHRPAGVSSLVDLHGLQRARDSKRATAMRTPTAILRCPLLHAKLPHSAIRTTNYAK